MPRNTKESKFAQCFFCHLLMDKEQTQELTAPNGQKHPWCGKCSKEKNMTDAVIQMFSSYGDGWDHIFSHETHVVERTSDITDKVTARLYCEDHKCAYTLSYENAWNNEGILYFVQEHIAANTKYVRVVFNSVLFGENEEGTPLKKVWENLASRERCEDDMLTPCYQPRNGYIIDHEDYELFSRPVMFEDGEEGVFFALVKYALLDPYKRYPDFFDFEIGEYEEGEVYLRVLEKGTNTMVGFLPVKKHFTWEKACYQEWMEQVGFIDIHEDEEEQETVK